MTLPERPYVVAHVSVSLDMMLTGFAVDLNLHYSKASELECDSTLIGSRTVLTGSSSYFRPETEADFIASGGEKLGWAVVIDSQGITKGLLHILRSSGYWRDVIVIHSEQTPDDFIEYLSERNYKHVSFGRERSDLTRGLSWLYSEVGVRRLLVDSGGSLIGHLLEINLCDELSLMMHPIIVGGPGTDQEIAALMETEEGHMMTGVPVPLFNGSFHGRVALTDCQSLKDGIIHLRFRIR